MSLRLSDHKVLHNIASSSSFFDFARIISLFSLGLSRFFRSYFVLQIFGVKEFNKTIIPFALVGNDWLGLGLGFTISYPTSAHGIIVKYSTCNSNNFYFTSLTRTGGCTHVPTNGRFFHKQYFFDA